MLRNILLLTFGSLALMLGLGYYTTDPSRLDKPAAAQVELLFDKIAFSGFGEGGPTGTGPYLRRWQEPVKIVLIGAPPENGDTVPWADGVKSMAALYDRLRGLDVAVVDQVAYGEQPGEQGNLQIVTIPPDSMEQVMDSLPPKQAGILGNARGGCLVLGSDAATLNTVTILIAGTASASGRATCLGESLATALGFTIEAKYTADVFRVGQGELRFHGLGLMAAELVYDPALHPGMPRDEARAVVAGLLKERGF
jgi:pimeloyl-ACP methyl ester carboxylesterase